jgi:hypothetical protein
MQGRSDDELQQRAPGAALYFALEAVEAAIMLQVLHSLPPSCPSVLYLFDGIWVHRAVEPWAVQQWFTQAVEKLRFPRLQLGVQELFVERSKVPLSPHLILPDRVTDVVFPYRRPKKGALYTLFEQQESGTGQDWEWDPKLPDWLELLHSWHR